MSSAAPTARCCCARRSRSGPIPTKLTERLEHWAKAAPDRIFMAQRDGSGGWRTVTYAQALEQARAHRRGAARRAISRAERPIVILSGNDIEHALLALGALYVGIPHAPISPAYSLVSSDFGGCGRSSSCSRRASCSPRRHAIRARHRRRRAGRTSRSSWRAIRSDRAATTVCRLCRDAGEQRGRRRARRGRPDTIAKFLFTSGSTGMPKGVINTQRMWCANQEMIAPGLAFFADEPPVIVDWAPWHHTAGGNHDVGLVLYNGGTLLHRRRQAAARRDRGDRAQSARDRADLVLHRAEGLRGAAAVSARRRGTARQFLQPPEGAVVRRRRHRAARVRRDAEARASRPAASTSCSSPASARPRPRPSRSAARGIRRMPPISACRRPASSSSSCRSSGKLEARLRGPNITPGYWRAARAHRAGVRRGRLLPARRRASSSPIRTTRRGPPVRRPHRRGLQALDRHLGQRRAAARRVHRACRAVRARRRDRRRATATRSPRWFSPISMPAAASRRDLPADAPRPRSSTHASVRREFRCAARQLRRRAPVHPTASRAHHALHRAAVARYRRDDRQGLDQPARRAEPPRRAGRGALRGCALAARHRDRGRYRMSAKRGHRAIVPGRLAARRRAHAVRRLQRRAARRSRRSISASRRRARRSRSPAPRRDDVGTVDHRHHGAGELRRLHAAAPHRALCRRADRGAGAHGAARLRHRHRGADAGGRRDHRSAAPSSRCASAPNR